MTTAISPEASLAARTVGRRRDRDAIVIHARRAAGQTGALAEMISERRVFAEVAQQLLAARGSLDALLIRLVELELATCLVDQPQRADVDALLRAALGGRLRDRAASGRAAGPRPTPSRGR
jgi:DNA-binding FrmR family transcriptional regulator